MSAVGSFRGSSRSVFVWALIGVVAINYLNVNYFLSLLTKVPGQGISLLTAVVPFGLALVIFRRLLSARWRPAHGVVVALLFCTILLFPVIDYAVHGAPNGMEDFLWWAKRAAVVFSLVCSGLLLAYFKAEGEMMMAAKILFGLALSSVVFSYFFPITSYGLFTGAGSAPLKYQYTLDRAMGSFLSPNLAAVALVYGYVAYAGLLEANQRSISLGGKALLDVAFLAALTQTGSRSGMLMGLLALAASTHAYFWRTRQAKKLALYVLAAGCLVLMLTLAGGLKEGYGEPLTRIVAPSATDADTSTTLRLTALTEALQLLSSHLAAGIGSFRLDAMMKIVPHNAYVSQALGIGIFGLVVYVSLLLMMWWSTPRGAIIARLIPIQLAVQSVFDDLVLHTKQFGYLFAVWIVLVSVRRFKKEPGNE